MKKRLIFLIVLSLMLNMCLSLPSLAVEGDTNSGGGSGWTPESAVAYWGSRKAVYRFSIVDNNFKRVSNVVDLTYNDATKYDFGSGFKDMYTNTRADSALSNSKGGGYVRARFTDFPSVFGTDQLPPHPISTGNQSVGQGVKFKQWFLRGTNGTSVYEGGGSSTPVVPEHVTPTINIGKAQTTQRPVSDFINYTDILNID